MESKQETWPLLTFKLMASSISPNPPTYQRIGGVWKLKQEQLLIDTVLRKMDIPKIYLRKLDHSPYQYEVVDGQQRIRALQRFLEDKFALPTEAKDIDIDGESYPVAGKKYSELDTPLKVHRIHICNLTVVIISEAGEDQVADLFYRLNNGTPLTPAEVRNSMPGEVTKFVRQLAVHPFFKKCAFNNWRRAHDQVAAQMLCLELSGGLTDISDKVLTPMYAHEHWRYRLPAKVTKDIRKNLGLLDRIFTPRSALLKRATAINMYLLISYLSKHHNLAKATDDIREWFEETEIKRLKDPEYQFLMTRAANSRASIEGRFQWVLSEFTSNSDRFRLVELDPKRTFDYLQKAEIFARDGGRCQGVYCGGKTIEDDRWHADHIVPWIQGGRTTVDNGQTLCPMCNLKKGAEFPLWSVSV